MSDYADLSDTEEPHPKQEPWSEDAYRSVLRAWPADTPTVFVSYDHPEERLSLDQQVERARELFRPHGGHLHTLLLKPETRQQNTLRETLRKAIGSPDELSYFDVIGVTEREIGGSPGERMVAIARLRLAMDDHGLGHVPIHIFGALDPLSAILYFLAGAEIFDGLTWLRYGYTQGQCMYTHNHAVLEYGLDERDERVRVLIQSRNLILLPRIQVMLREFRHTQDFGKLEKLGSWPGAARFFKDAFDTLDTRLKGKA